MSDEKKGFNMKQFLSQAQHEVMLGDLDLEAPVKADQADVEKQVDRENSDGL